MNKPFIVDITQDNTPIQKGAAPAGKKGSCGGRCGGTCGTGHGPDRLSKKRLYLMLGAAIAGALGAVFFYS